MMLRAMHMLRGMVFNLTRLLLSSQACYKLFTLHGEGLIFDFWRAHGIGVFHVVDSLIGAHGIGVFHVVDSLSGKPPSWAFLISCCHPSFIPVVKTVSKNSFTIKSEK